MHKKIRILLVDDHAIVRNGVRMMLAPADDIEVADEVETAQDALRVVKEQDFDVALVDIALPDKSGLDLLRLMRSMRPRLAVLILSMYSEEIYAVRALRNGAAGYLAKNCASATLIEAVRQVAAGRRYISPALKEKLVELATGTDDTQHASLTDRELEVLKRLASGESLVSIANAMHLSPSTITTYRARIMEKTGLTDNAKLTRYALEHGLLV